MAAWDVDQGDPWQLDGVDLENHGFVDNPGILGVLSGWDPCQLTWPMTMTHETLAAILAGPLIHCRHKV